MSPNWIIALDGDRIITEPSEQHLATWAYETRCGRCATCRRGETWCDTGRNLLAATAPASDTPGYPAL